MFTIAPSFVKAEETYSQCVAAKTAIIRNGAKPSIYGTGALFTGVLIYNKILECNALPDAPAVTPSDMVLNEAQLKLVSDNPMPAGTMEYYFPPKPAPVVTPIPTPTPTPTPDPIQTPEPSNPPIITGVPTPTPQPTPTPIKIPKDSQGCPDTSYLVNQVTSLQTSYNALTINNSSYINKTYLLQSQLDGANAQIANLTKALNDANVKLKAASEETVAVPVAPVVSQGTTASIDVIVEPTKEDTNVFHKFTNWVTNIFK